MTAKDRHIGSAPLWIITALGVTMTAFGVYIQSTSNNSAMKQTAAGTLAAVGGGIIGAAISLYFSAGDGRDALFAVRELLSGSLRARMRSNEEDLRPVRRQWHYYHLTQRDGEFLWRYTDYRFDQSNTTGSIVLSIKDTSFGREHLYRTEVAVRGDRVIVVDAPEDGSEPPIVSVTPFFTEEYRKVRAGVVFLRSWDGRNLVSKCLWSLTALVVPDGCDVRPEDGAKLDAMWHTAFEADQRILPSVGVSPAVAPKPRSEPNGA